MSITAICPVADLAANNATLDAGGWGPKNFSIPVYGSSGRTTHGALHSWDIPGFQAALEALPNVSVTTSVVGLPTDRVQALVDAESAEWPENSPVIPDSGTINPGEYYRYERDFANFEYWRVIQAHDRSIFGGDPNQYPALIREARIPGTIKPWVQPIDQFDAYLTLDPFTGEGERVTHSGSTWLCTDGSAGGPAGSLINTWAPGVFGWTEE